MDELLRLFEGLRVAYDDGVIVVPREVAEEVAYWARKELDADKRARRNFYEQLGMPLNETVQ
jgi:4-hydroxy-4-methyl-2-oxoglutarate aldolase